MRAWPLALFLAACSMPAVPSGFQLNCNSDSSNPNCPSGTTCVDYCCVHPGETPSCPRNLQGSTSNGLLGSFCGPGCANESCQANCIDGLNCYGEKQTGIPGGACTKACRNDSDCTVGNVQGHCETVSLLDGTRKICLASASCSSGNCNCSQGRSQQCSNGPCWCQPDCNGNYDCAKGTHAVAGASCDKASGLCEPAGSTGVGAGCGSSSGCASGLTCYDEAHTGFPGGLCSQSCGSCPSGSDCLQIAGAQFCLPQCTPGSSSTCRTGYVCNCSVAPGCHCVPACETSGGCSQGPCCADGLCKSSSHACGAPDGGGCVATNLGCPQGCSVNASCSGCCGGWCNANVTCGP